jgi:hypothetical protein
VFRVSLAGMLDATRGINTPEDRLAESTLAIAGIWRTLVALLVFEAIRLRRSTPSRAPPS